MEQEVNGTYESVFEPSEYIPLKKKSSFNSPIGSMVLYKGKSKKNSTTRYRLRMWCSNDQMVSLGDYGIEISVNGK